MPVAEVNHRKILDFAKHVQAIASGRAPGKHLTELRVAEWLVRDHGQDFRHCGAFGWMLCVDGVWRPDTTGEIFRRAKITVRRLYAEAERIEDDIVRKAMIDFARSCESIAKIKAIVEHAKTEPGIAIDPSVFDADMMKLCVRNGVVCLKTGQLHPPCREEYHTKQAGTEYDPSTPCPRYERFIKEIFASNAAMVPFCNRKCGYNLTGLVTEQQFDIWHGDGDNGKSKLTELIFEIMGDYAVRTPAKLLCIKRNEGHSTERMVFRGARFVSSAESGESVTLDEEFIKSMTGGDTVTARLCHKDNISFPPTWKLQMFTNHRPKIMGTDFGIWRRVHLWPYLEKFTDPADPADPQPGEKDKDILDKMRHEQPGILAKWVEGCLEWQRTGLKPPTCVVEATKEYREESDVIGQFLNECCEVHAGAEAAAGSLYKVYRMHAGENGLRPLSNVNFSKRLLQRTGIDRTDGAMRTYTGLRIQNEWFERLYEGNTKDEHNAQCEVIPF